MREYPDLSSAGMRCTGSLGAEGVYRVGVRVGVEDDTSNCSLERSMSSFACEDLLSDK